MLKIDNKHLVLNVLFLYQKNILCREKEENAFNVVAIMRRPKNQRLLVYWSDQLQMNSLHTYICPLLILFF